MITNGNIPTKSRAQHRQPRHVALFAERFPATFSTNLELIKPIAIGVRQAIQLQCPDNAPKALRLAIGVYCSHLSYQRALIAGAARIDIDGNPSGIVSQGAEARLTRFLA
jgi:ProP effector